MRGPYRIHACIQVCSARTRQRAIHAVVFVGIQVILKICAVPSLLALTLAYAVVRIAASRQPDVHSSSCRTAMAIAVFFGSCVIGNFLWALLGLMLVLAAPRPFLWWPAKPQEGDEEMQLVQAVAESRSEAAGESSFEQAVAVGVALAELRASRGAAAASRPEEEFEDLVIGPGEAHRPPSEKLSSAPRFSLQAARANRGASLQLLATAHPHTASLKLDAAAEWLPSCLLDADGVSFTPCQTQGAGGACAIHSVFGWPQQGSFSHGAPREFARSLLGPSLAALRSKVSKEMEMTLQRITTSLWGEFFLPYLRSYPSREATCFARALKRMLPELLEEMSALVQAKTREDRSYISAKVHVETAARSLFCKEAEKHFIRPVAVSLGLLPNSTTDFLHYTAAELQQHATQWDGGPYDFLQEAS